jgi:hypothetical protein
MNVAFGARTNWGKSYVGQCYTERNQDEFDRVVIIDYKHEYVGLVESGLLKRLTVPPRAVDCSVGWWRDHLANESGVQLARAGCTDEEWREAMGTAVEALAGLEGRRS